MVINKRRYSSTIPTNNTTPKVIKVLYNPSIPTAGCLISSLSRFELLLYAMIISITNGMIIVIATIDKKYIGINGPIFPKREVIFPTGVLIAPVLLLFKFLLIFLYSVDMFCLSDCMSLSVEFNFNCMSLSEI